MPELPNSVYRLENGCNDSEDNDDDDDDENDDETRDDGNDAAGNDGVGEKRTHYSCYKC